MSPNFDRAGGSGKRRRSKEPEGNLPVKAAPPVVIEARCHVCMSNMRMEIDKLIVMGKSHQWISDHMKERGEEVSRQSVGRHARAHLNYQDEALRQIAEEEAKKLGENYEEGVRGILKRKVFLETVVEKGLSQLQEDEMELQARDVAFAIQELSKLEEQADGGKAALYEAQFNAFVDAVRELVGEEALIEIHSRAQELFKRSGSAGELPAQ